MRQAVQLILLATALAMSPPSRAVTPDVHGIDVSIVRDGGALVVDVEMVVAATPAEAWDVLTDYDHMADFVSNVAASRIVGREGERLEVAQTSRLSFGLLQFTFDNVREIELVPFSAIRSRLVSGDMKASAFTTRLEPDGDGATRVHNHGRFLTDRWIPPLIGTAILESETRKQFAEFRAEIMRRKASATASR
jgi:carbon monoxide dehydrogenase subunit G